MTDAELQAYYVSLLIMQYIDKVKAVATVSMAVAPIIMNQIPITIANAFGVETAIGDQLDVVGKYVGVVRTGYNLDGDPVTLDDDDFRQLIKMVIISNNAGSSLATIQDLLARAFPQQIFVSDNQNMGLNYAIVETIGTPDLLAVLVTGGYLPKPMGVQVSASVIPVPDNPFFGFVTYEDPVQDVTGWNDYNFYQLDQPWLQYPGT